METLAKKITLIDDDKICNLLNELVINKTHLAKEIKSYSLATAAIVELQQLSDDKSSDFPDIIFLDINMPVMDGWEFLEAYSALEGKLPDSISIYLVSSSVDKNDIMRSQQFQYITDYLVKPVYKEKFSQVLLSAKN